jgi:hypothetical protein
MSHFGSSYATSHTQASVSWWTFLSVLRRRLIGILLLLLHLLWWCPLDCSTFGGILLVVLLLIILLIVLKHIVKGCELHLEVVFAFVPVFGLRVEIGIWITTLVHQVTQLNHVLKRQCQYYQAW